MNLSKIRYIIVLTLLFILAISTVAKADYFLLDSFFSTKNILLKLPMEVSALTFDNNNNLYILDKRENKLQLYSSSGILVREMATDADTIAVDPWGNLYTITNGRFVSKIDQKGRIIARFTLEGEKNAYEYISYRRMLSVDQRGYLYIVNAGTGEASVFSPEGKFVGTIIKSDYGSTDLNMVSGLSIDPLGNIYIVGTIPQITSDRFSPVLSVVKKINYQGYEVMRIGPLVNARILSIGTDKLENLFILDSSNGIVYKYDKRGSLVTSFFVGNSATSIAVRSDGYLAIGYDNGEVKLFHPSRLMVTIDKANQALLDGDYDSAISFWNEALRLNNYMNFIHSGLGETYLAMKEYSKALEEFKLAQDKARYSNTVILYRRELFYRYIFLWGILGIVLLSVIFLFWNKAIYIFRNIIGKTIYKPVDALQLSKGKPLIFGIFIILAIAFIDALNRRYTNYIFQPNTEGINYIFFRRLIMFSGLWFISGTTFYGVGEIFDGLGTWKECMVTTAMCVIPYLLLSFPTALLSNLLTFQEKVYYDYIQRGLILWGIGLFLVNVKVTQQLGMGRTLLIFLVTGVGILVAIAIVLFLQGVNLELWSFIKEVYLEVWYRLVGF
jgi:tetratricopeptide (TPR) repeat protein